MNTLTIKDLARTCELDHKAMATVRGGHNTGSASFASFPTFSMQSYAPSITATQDMRQAQQVLNETADGSAFVSGVTANNQTSQYGQNNILVG